jgi:hypothetical protein
VRGAERLTERWAWRSPGRLTVLALATSAEMLALVFAAARHQWRRWQWAAWSLRAYNATVSLGLAALAHRWS